MSPIRKIDETNGYSLYQIGRYLMAQEIHGGRWDIMQRSSAQHLGRIVWYQRWKCRVFQPATATEFSADCLASIIAFISMLDKAGSHVGAHTAICAYSSRPCDCGAK